MPVLFHNGPLSNWYSSPFSYGTRRFANVEQWMMYWKAVMMKDTTTAQTIMATTNPKRIKELGRTVHGFDQSIWDKYKYRLVLIGCTAKFSQNDKLKQILIDTKDELIAEASPWDNIWGIGLSEHDIRAQDQAQWKGENLLGKVLMEVRQKLRS